LLNEGKKVMFSPDRNMGAYLNHKLNIKMPIWSAVCEVHDRFDYERMAERFEKISPDKRFLISHPESPMAILNMSDFIASTKGMLEWVENYDGPKDATIFVATEYELLEIMKQKRPDLKVSQVPEFTGCRCVTCPYMKLNTMQKVQDAISGKSGIRIDYISDEQAERARLPIERMVSFKETVPVMGI
jgi:quinolinate synthase